MSDTRSPIAGNEAQIRQEVMITRQIYNQDLLNVEAGYQEPHQTFSRICIKLVKSCGFGKCIRNSVPIIKWLPKYNIRNFLLNDIVAGATTAVMLIPQGMAYALLADVPPIMGLYTAFFPVLIYVILGNSPHVSMGTFSIACIMARKAVHEHANKPGEANSVYTPMAILSLLAFMVGIFQIIMWCLRLGGLTALLSEPLISGFTTGASMHVVMSQVKDLFGIKLPLLPTYCNLIHTVIEVCKNIPKTNSVAFAISFNTCLFLVIHNEHLKPWISKRSRFPLPAELIAMIIGTLLSKSLKLNDMYKINIVGDIPTGLPAPAIPPLELFGATVTDGLTQTLVTYTITLCMGLIFASKEKYQIDANQELLAMGASNIFGSFFSCTPLCASLSRSYIQYLVGGKTLITSFISAMLILLVLLWIGQFFEELPRCVLASIVVVSLKGLLWQVKDLKKFCKLSKVDATVWIVTFLVTLIVSIDIGLAAGLVANLGTLFFRAETPYVCLLGRVKKTDIFFDVNRYRAVQEIPGIKIFHYCGALNILSKNVFRNELLQMIHQHNPIEASFEQNQIDSGPSNWYPDEITLQCVVFDASSLSYIDIPGMRMLVSIWKELAADDISLFLASVNGPIQEDIKNFISSEKEGLQLTMFPTVFDAVEYHQAITTKDKVPVSFKSVA